MKLIILSTVLVMLVFGFTSAEAKQDDNKKSCIGFKPDVSLVSPDNFSDYTFGFSWEFDCKGPGRILKNIETERFEWMFDNRFILKSEGALLLQNELNRDPIELTIAYDIGFQVRPISGTVDPTNLTDKPAKNSLPWWGNYRFAFYLEGGAEADQGWDNPLLRAGPAFWFLNTANSSNAALLPTLSIGLNAIYSLERPEIQDNRINDWYTRFYVMSRHEINLSIFDESLSGFNLTGVLQYSKDFGQIEEYNDHDFDTAFGWFADLSYAIRIAREGKLLKRSDLFVRISDGRIAPLLDDARSFKFGLRWIYKS